MKLAIHPLPFVFTAMLAAAVAAAGTPKALVIMLDGQRGDTIDNGLAPNLRRLADGQWQPGYNGAWTLWAGTVRDATTESSPNHVAIATGMTAAKTGIDWNPDLVARDLDEAKLPTWQTRLVRKRPGTRALFITAWKTDLNISPSHDVKLIMDKEEACPGDLVEILAKPDAPDAIMWYCGIPDEAGHAQGYYPYSDLYLKAVTEADGWVGDVLATIAARPTFDQEDWLIAVTADHGGWERTHGQRSTACYTIPLILAGRHVRQGRMPGVPRNYDIAPTVLAHFGVDISGMDFDGQVRGNDAPIELPRRPLSDGLAVWLPFTGGSLANKGAADVVAELHGAAATVADGHSGGALRVSASTNALGSVLLKGSERLAFDNGKEFAFATWIRVPGPQSGNPVVFANKDWRDGCNPGVAFAASQGVDMSRVYPGHYDYKKRGNHRDFMFNCGREGGKREDLGVFKPIHGQWMFYAATRGPDGVCRFYQGCPDGTLYCLGDDLSDIAVATGLPFSIGQDGTGAFPDAFVGDIDEFAIWTRALDHDDVRRIFERGIIGRGTLISHKGESGEAPENTMASFRLAVERGFGFECDIALSKDGRVFTFHDKDFAKITGGAVTNRCADMTWDEISRIDIGVHGRWKGSDKFAGTHPALLEEVLELARDGRWIYVDTAGPEIIPYVREVFARQGRATPDNTLFLTADVGTCRAIRRELPGFKVLWVMTSRHWEKPGFPPVTADEMLAAIRSAGADGVDCHYDSETVTAEAVAAVHAAGYSFHVWTVDNLDDAEEAFRRGVDTLTTNYAGRLLEAHNAALCSQ